MNDVSVAIWVIVVVFIVIVVAVVFVLISLIETQKPNDVQGL